MDTLPQIDETKQLSPMMVQWQTCKQAAGDAILLFRMGDFYEAFYDDAVQLAREAELTLTKRQEIPMSGIPWTTVETYIDKLIGKGFRVAIAEQTEDPKQAKGIVKREVVRVVTPGSLISSSLLSDKSNNYFASLSQVGSIFGLAFLDLTTAEFRSIEFDQIQELINEVYKISPSEILISRRFRDKHLSLIDELEKNQRCLLSNVDDWHFEAKGSYDFLVNHFNVHNLDGFGLKGQIAGANAAGALLRHLKETLCLNVDHIRELSTYTTSQFMSLDRATQRNLELTASLNEGGKKNTLLGVLDETLTPMGGRHLRRWITQPLLDVNEIKRRQDGVEVFYTQTTAVAALREMLSSVRDLERLIMRISSGCATPRDLLALKVSLEPIETIKSLLQGIQQPSELIAAEEMKLNPLPELSELLTRAIVDEPPLRTGEGGIFRDGFHAELDELRSLSQDSKSWIANYQVQLRESSGIKTLKIGFTKAFGYYIEVSRGQAEKTPSDFIRRQTLVNAERYITPVLKDYEQKVLTAEERMIAIESELFSQLRQHVANFATQILNIAHALANIDCLQSLGYIARQRRYTRPQVSEGLELYIEAGRHPVIEALHVREPFVPNDTFLDSNDNRLHLITGPNMAGKSTYIRQVALLAIMAQIGSFIPAEKANIGLIDKVFTRIGASDDLSRGRSTFMVEMSETANILNHASDRSLVILDEIGRGTSTYDGISIAWSIAEYLLTTDGKRAKTLFATHYWELTKLEGRIPGAINYNVAVHESDDQIVFLRKIIKGGTDKSYGIHVARLAGLPIDVVNRAKEVLADLEASASHRKTFEPPAPPAPKPRRTIRSKSTTPSNEIQLTFFG